MKIKHITRIVAENFSRRKIIKRHINIKGRRVPVFVSPDSQLKYLKFGQTPFDHDLIWLAETFLKEESTAWDIGANVGVFTFAAAAVAFRGTVLSVEADLWLASILRRSVRLEANKNKDIRVLPTAISEANSVASFLVAARGRASNSLEEAGGRSQMGGIRERQYVPTLTLDSISRSTPEPDLIKIDVEGAELMVLKGATEIMAGIRPVFYVEVGKHVSTEVLKLFQKKNYLAFDIRTGTPIDRCLHNTLFIPEENKEAQQQIVAGCKSTRGE